MLAKTKYYKYLISKKPENISYLDSGTVDIVITQNKIKESTFTLYFLYYRLIDKETGLLIKKVHFGHYRSGEQSMVDILILIHNLYSSFI